MPEIEITIDGTMCKVPAREQTVADLLRAASLTVGDAELVTPDGTAHDNPDETIHLGDGDRLTTRPTTIRYQVNGEDQTAPSSSMTAGAILKRAGRPASIDVGELDSYYLENLADGRHYDCLSDEVQVHDGDRFIAVHRGATPVA